MRILTSLLTLSLAVVLLLRPPAPSLVSTDEVLCTFAVGHEVYVGTTGGLLRVAPTFRHFTVRDGLPSMRVQALATSPSGTLLIGTDRGLAEMYRTGYVHRVWTADVQGVAAFHDKVVVGTAEGTWAFRWGSAAEPTRVAAESAHCFEVVDGRLWMGTHGGVLRWDGESLDPVGLPSELAGDVQSMTLWRGQLWIATLDGVWAWDDEIRVHSTNSEFLESAVWSDQAAIGPDVPRRRDVGAFVRRSEGLPGLQVSSLRTWRGKLLAATYDSGLATLEAPEAAWQAMSGPADDVWRVAVTPSQTLWAGSMHAGAWSLDPGLAWQRACTQDGPPDNSVTSIFVGPHGTWVGSSNGGVARLKEHWRRYELDGANRRITRVVEFRGRPYARTAEGRVLTLRDGAWVPVASLGKVWASMLDVSEGRLLVGSWGVLLESTDGASWRRTRVPEVAGQVVTAALRDGDTLWIGTAWAGVVRVRKGRGQLVSVDGWVTGMVAHDSRIWVGTYGGGLSSWDGRAWSTPDLPSKQITALLSAHGRLWVGTGDGLLSWDGRAWSPVTSQTGLLDPSVQCLASTANQILVGTPAGISMVTP